MFNFRRSALLLLLICLPLVAASCAGSDGELKGDLSLDGSRAQQLPSLMPANVADLSVTEVAIAELLADPVSYHGQFLQVEGLFQSTQMNYCADKRLGSPVSWTLADGDSRIDAGGLEHLAAALPDGQINLVVEGAWRSWPNPANCRQEGDPADLFYLDVTRIIAPNPIALAPGNGQAFVAAGPTTLAANVGIIAADQPLAPTVTRLISIPTATPNSALDQAPPLTITTEVLTAPLNPTPAPQGAYPGTADIPTAVPKAYPGPGGEDGQLALTPVVTQPRSTPVEETLLDRDLLPPGSLETGALGNALSERWTYVVTTTQAIDVQVVPDAGLELIATIMDDHGQVLSAETSAEPGQLVTLPAVILSEAGDYTILITTLGDSAGNYAVLLSDESSYNFLFQGNLVDSLAMSGNLAVESDHFYFFTGVAGDTVDITVNPMAEADLFLRLFDPDGSGLIAFHDENPAGQGEQIVAYNLPETGLYSLLIGEQAFAGGAYEVVLERQ